MRKALRLFVIYFQTVSVSIGIANPHNLYYDKDMARLVPAPNTNNQKKDEYYDYI